MISGAEETGIASGLLLCRNCNFVNRHAVGANHCARCGSVLHYRIPDSLAKTWALVLSATVMLLPANLYPVMSVIYFGRGEPDTIMSGVIQLAQAGMLPIAVLVFIASIAVPVMKLVGIVFLLLMVQWRWALSARQCTVMYRFIETIGRWSMLDLFMISILVTLVDLGKIAKIEAGSGATAFAAVVVLTLFAAKTFDPRLIWDNCGSPKEGE